MPYYVYKIQEGENQARKLELQQEFDVYKEAKNKVRDLRATHPADDHITFKIIFADSETLAEQKLREVREQPILKEWEK